MQIAAHANAFLVLLLSFSYHLTGRNAGYYLTRKGAALFR